MEDHVYRIIEVAGSSETGIDDAIRNAVARASRTLHHLRWFEVLQTKCSRLGVMSRTARSSTIRWSSRSALPPMTRGIDLTLVGKRVGAAVRTAGAAPVARPGRMKKEKT
jgi:flavin-binding protein dodecin